MYTTLICAIYNTLMHVYIYNKRAFIYSSVLCRAMSVLAAIVNDHFFHLL